MNRRKLGYKTAIVALVVAIVEGLLNLIRTKAVLVRFGDSTNAIMQVAVQITSYLVLFESGMTAAYQLKLYQPLSDHNIDRISALFLGLKKNMRNIVIAMFLAINVISFVYVFFFLNTKDSRTYAFMIFFVMGLRFVSPYLFTLTDRTILYASEKGYVVTILQGVLQCTTLLIESILCYFTKLPLPIILFAYIVGVILIEIIYKIYRIKKLKLNIRYDIAPDMEPTRMTKDILVHQVSGMITSNTDNILLSIMSQLKNVTIYSSYNTIINFPISLFNSITGSMKSSVIIKIQKKERNSFAVYENILNLSCYIMSIVTAVFFSQINRFIILWIGAKYCLDIISTALFSAVLFNQVVLTVLTIGIDAKGLYKETKKYAIAQAVVNFSLTIILIPVLGIKGALIGTVISYICVKLPFMSKTIYKDVFYCRNTGIKIIINGFLITCIASASSYLVSKIWLDNNWITFIASSLCSLICAICLTTIGYLIFERSMMNYFLKGIVSKIRNKKWA